MIKRILGTFLAAVILLGALPVMAEAANPSDILITRQPQNPYYPAGSTAIWSVDAWAEGSSLYYRWHIIYEGKDYSFPGDGTEPWSNYAGSAYGVSPDGKSMYMNGIEEELNGAKVYCVIEDGHDMVKSCEAQVVVLPQNNPAPPEVKVVSSLEVDIGNPADLYCYAVSPDGSALEYQWYKTETGELKDIRALSEESDTLHIDTSKAYSAWYVCMVTTSKGGRTYSNPIRVVVNKTNNTETLVNMEITTLPTKLTYKVGEKLDLSGIKLRVYTDMGFRDITDSSSCTVKPSQFTTPGDIKVTVQYMSLSATYTVKVTENVTAPVIKTQPEGQTVSAGSTATFTVKAEGNDLHYKWMGADATGTPEQFGDDSATLTLSKSEVESLGSSFMFWCVVSNAGGKVETKKVSLTVTPANNSDTSQSEKPTSPTTTIENPDNSSSEQPTDASEDVSNDQPERSGIPVWLSSVLFAVLGAAVCAGVIATVLLLKKRKNK